MPTPPSIMILGPSEWLPTGIPSVLKDDGQTPLETRRMAARLIREFGVPAVLMEEHSLHDGENNFRCFLRLIATENVQTYLLIWPLGAKLHGTTLEIGLILQQISAEKMSADDVFMLVEQHAFELVEDADGELVLSHNEPGNRTRYYQDLADEGCPILIWDGPGALRLAVLNVALAHASRHGPGPTAEPSQPPMPV